MNDISARRDFSGVRAVVTGGASGIGAAIARALSASGARVAIADVADSRTAELAASIGPNARAYHCDVTDRGDLEALAGAVTAVFGGVDLVFVNAGAAVQSSLPEMDPREFDWLIDLNLRGAFNTIQAFADVLIAQARIGRRPRFILTGSENSVGLPKLGVLTAYTATKHAILGMADGLRRDLADQGVGVSVLCPGAVNTRLWDARSTRQDRYGGPAHVPDDVAETLTKGFASFGQDPDVTARLCLDGIAEDEFLIVTHPEIRTLAQKRNLEIEVALDRLDARLASYGK
ncbi:MAG TPA: SDR family oxidoreductase [Steroidobacteraceae bacterium]|nr:SDR family oxidoreductase [Steroidobacteraceae bacterium]